MKMILTILIIVALIVSLNKGTSARTEKQKYETLLKNGEFEIRFYPEAILASVRLNGNYDNSRNSGFRVLAGYIFGNNYEKQKIAMTAPVRMSDNEGINTMSFVMPSKMEFDNLPEPVNKSVELHKSTPVYTASIRYGGYTNSSEIEKHKQKLVSKLNELGIEHTGRFEYLGYNPPYQMINRRNEVIVELKDFDPDLIRKVRE